MSLKLYNTMSRSVEEFMPLEGNHVRMYTCGPTVYNFAHIGNFRAYIFEDLLRRYLKYKGYQVTQVMNLTDVDDKTINGATELRVTLLEYTQKYKDAFFADLDTLGIERAEHYPAATDHIPEMIALIEILIQKGHAYHSDDGSVYFSIASCPDYGRLARLDLAGLRAGARVTHDEYEKENLADFALWKAWDETDGDVLWESPWGQGRPGWHIECSAMSMKLLGESFEIHTGGVDNIFPHHVDEIAQSESATGKPYARYWLHNAHLMVNGEKMSKKKGNFFTLRDLLEQDYAGREIRYELLATHYRQSLNFTLNGLDAVRSALGRIDEFSRRLEELPGDGVDGDAPEWLRAAESHFEKAMDDDLNIADALSALFDMIRDGNKALDENRLSPSEAHAVRQTMNRFDTVLGVISRSEEKPDDEVLGMAHLRELARRSKNWMEADRLRDDLAARGWVVKDTPQGSKLLRK